MRETDSQTPRHKHDKRQEAEKWTEVDQGDGERSEQIGQSVTSRRKVQTWGGGRDSGLGGKVAPTEPPPPYPHTAHPPPLPSLTPSSEAKRWGAARQMVAAGAWEGARVEGM